MLTVFGFKMEHKWNYFCERVGDNKILSYISSIPETEMEIWHSEQRARQKLIKEEPPQEKQGEQPGAPPRKHR